jgi:hypothetical protein
MSWFEVILSREQATEGISEKIHSDFEELFVKAGKPPEMALFCDIFPVPQFSMYFSPAFAQYGSDLIEPGSEVLIYTPHSPEPSPAN